MDIHDALHFLIDWVHHRPGQQLPEEMVPELHAAVDKDREAGQDTPTPDPLQQPTVEAQLPPESQPSKP